MKKESIGPVLNPLCTMPASSHGFEAFHACEDSMHSWEYHSHDFYEIYIHVKGADFFCLDNDRYALQPNVLLIIPPFSMHGLAQAGYMKRYERGYLNVSTEKLREFGCGQQDLDVFFRTYTSCGRHMFSMTEEECAFCLHQLDLLQETKDQDTPLDRFHRCAMVISFLSAVCRLLSRSGAVADRSMPQNDIMQDVLTYINRNYTQTITINDLARRFCISASYLSHEFSRYTRRSVYDYVLYRRIMLAREMISTPMSLNNIAYQCGFNDYSNFLRAFNKLVGMSPREYRELRREQVVSA